MKFDSRFFKNLYNCEKRITIPTLFTLLRIALVPVIVIAMLNENWGSAFVWFVIASLTDVIDGNLARWWDDKTVLGACLDPLADKILLVSTFFTLAFIQSPLFPIPYWFVVLVIIKESVVILGALWLLIFGSGFTVNPTKLGKMTTAVQVSFIFWLFACYFFDFVPTRIVYCMIAIMVSFILISFVQYVWIGLRYILAMVVDL